MNNSRIKTISAFSKELGGGLPEIGKSERKVFPKTIHERIGRLRDANLLFSRKMAMKLTYDISTVHDRQGGRHL